MLSLLLLLLSKEIGRGLSRESILPNIIYELIDGMDDDKFDEMCRRLGADRELRSLKRYCIVISYWLLQHGHLKIENKGYNKLHEKI